VKDKAVVEQTRRPVLLRNASYQAVSEAIAGPVALGARRLRAARSWYRDWSWVAGWVFAAMTLAPALLAVAWLLPGTGMLLSGRLLPVPMLIIFVPLAIALCYFAMRQRHQILDIFHHFVRWNMQVQIGWRLAHGPHIKSDSRD